MWSNQLFCNRVFGCSYYKQEDNYDKTLHLFFDRVIKAYAEVCKSSNAGTELPNFYDLFTYEFRQKPPAGRNVVYSDDIETFEDLCLKCAEVLNVFFITKKPTHLLDEFVWRNKITGNIGCRIVNKNKEINVDFSTLNSQDLYYNIYYHKFNNWIYNKINNLCNDMIVYMVRTGQFYVLKYNENDYTIKHGFLNQNIYRRTHRPGHQCITCKIKNCKPRLTYDFERI